jgi:hypothetical protein
MRIGDRSFLTTCVISENNCIRGPNCLMVETNKSRPMDFVELGNGWGSQDTCKSSDNRMKSKKSLLIILRLSCESEKYYL